MGSATGKGSRVARFIVVAAAVVILGLLLVAPAMALDATSLTATARPTTVTFGQGVMISAVLMDTAQDMAVGGEWVRVEQSASNTGPWSLLYSVTADAGAYYYYTGTYIAAVLPVQRTFYRFVYPGSGIYAGATSNVLKVLVKPLLGRSTCPSKVMRYQSFTVKGRVRPGAPAAPAVRIQVYRHKGSKWVSYATHSAKVTGTQYSHRFKIAVKGTFKFRAIVSSSAEFVGVKSMYSRVLTVK